MGIPGFHFGYGLGGRAPAIRTCSFKGTEIPTAGRAESVESGRVDPQ
jgi:hypothetical protein